MESNKSQNFFNSVYQEGTEIFISQVNKEPGKFSDEEIKTFLQSLFKKSEAAQSIPDKVDLKQFLLENIKKCKFSERENLAKDILFELSKAKLGEAIKSKINLRIGSEKPDNKTNTQKKAYLNLEFLTDKKTQSEALAKFTNEKDAFDFQNSFGLLKLQTSNPQEAKEIVEQLLDLAKQVFESFNKDAFRPEFKTSTSSDSLLVEISQQNNLSFCFYSCFLRCLAARLPEFDLNLNIKAQFGTNFKDLISQHTDNTVKDLLDGARISIELRNNIVEFFKVTLGLLQKKDLSRKDAIMFSLLMFLVGSVSLNTDLKVCLGQNEESLMKQFLPFVNVFEKNEALESFLQIYKMMKEENEMVKDLMPILNSFEGKVMLLLNTPVASLSLEFDGVGLLDLVNYITDSQ